MLARTQSLVAAVVLLQLLPAGARATQAQAVECPEQDPTACGRRYFEAGTAAFEAGDYTAAKSAFHAAMELRPHAVIRFNLALSLLRLGQPSAAIEQLRQVTSDPGADKDLRERAAREEKSAVQILARVTFRLADPSREHVELDGKPLAVPQGGELSLDPGGHHVRVVSGNSVVLDQELELAPGERVELRVGERSRRIDVVVVPPENGAPPPVGRRVPVAPTPTRELSPLWFYVSAGATLAAGGVTAWSALDTRSALNDYERDLRGLTQTQADARVRDGHSRELRTNLLLAGSLVLGAGTAVLGIWFVDFGGSARTAVALGPSQVAVAGRF